MNESVTVADSGLRICITVHATAGMFRLGVAVINGTACTLLTSMMFRLNRPGSVSLT